jgi:tRNA G37 N-methylase Trm5
MAHILKKILSETLTPDEISQVCSAFDMIGSIVIVKIPDPLKLKKQIIGEKNTSLHQAGKICFCTNFCCSRRL